VACELGYVNRNYGLRQVWEEFTLVADDEIGRQVTPDLGPDGRRIYFAVDPSFAPWGVRNYRITAQVGGINGDAAATVALFYEHENGYLRRAAALQDIPNDNAWHRLSWTVDDAVFSSKRPSNFYLQIVGEMVPFTVKEVRVTKVGVDAIGTH
jgi:hypothetical protein